MNPMNPALEATYNDRAMRRYALEMALQAQLASTSAIMAFANELYTWLTQGPNDSTPATGNSSGVQA